MFTTDKRKIYNENNEKFNSVVNDMSHRHPETSLSNSFNGLGLGAFFLNHTPIIFETDVNF